jgi:hypothetical protein
MITAVIGRTFLNAYNNKYKKELSPKEFFIEEYFELFYNHPKYLQWVTNSPFVQMKSGQKVHLLNSEERLLKLEELHFKIENETPDGSFVLGYPASTKKEFNSTSSLVSDITIPTSKDEMYLSWFGHSLSIGVGAYNLLFNEPEILLSIYDGWKIYRKILNDPLLTHMGGNQVITWNGQWTTYFFHNDFEEGFDFTNLEDFGFFKSSDGILKIDTIKWSRLFFSLSKKIPNKILLAYVCNISDTNKTVGFIPFQLKSGVNLKTIYRKLTNDASITPENFDILFGMNFKRACELGSIGLHALRPDGLVKYMNENKNISFKNDGDKINYFIYKTWLIAMMSKNKEEVKEYTVELAKTILRYRNSGTKNDRKNLVEKELFEAKSKKGFIEHLTTMVKDLDEHDLSQVKNLKDEIHLMTNEEFGYFSTLLKFDYAYLEKQS